MLSVPVAKDTWTKINVNPFYAGRIWLQSLKPSQYVFTVVNYGDNAPSDLSAQIPIRDFFQDLSYSNAVDLYLYCKKNGGSVLLDTNYAIGGVTRDINGAPNSRSKKNRHYS